MEGAHGKFIDSSKVLPVLVVAFDDNQSSNNELGSSKGTSVFSLGGFFFRQGKSSSEGRQVWLRMDPGCTVSMESQGIAQ